MHADERRGTDLSADSLLGRVGDDWGLLASGLLLLLLGADDGCREPVGVQVSRSGMLLHRGRRRHGNAYIEPSRRLHDVQHRLADGGLRLRINAEFRLDAHQTPQRRSQRGAPLAHRLLALALAVGALPGRRQLLERQLQQRRVAVYFHVYAQVVGAVARLPADRARVPSDLGVHGLPVFGQAALVREAAAALVTDVRLEAGVPDRVCLEPFLRLERLAALITGERLPVGVDQVVRVQRRIRFEHLPAHLALVPLGVAVYLNGIRI